MGRAHGLGTRAEDEVVAALHARLTHEEILLTGVRITDPREGDVEADIIVLFPDLGAAVIEVKGGRVEYRDGQWTTSRGAYRRRIHPTEQARKAKHALRRYLDRQPEWQGPLLRSAWFVAAPQTTIEGDMGPEGERSHLIDEGDLPQVRERVRQVLASTLDSDPIPAAGWEQDVLALLLRTRGTSMHSPRRRRRTVGLAALGTIAVLGGFGWWLISGTSSTPAEAVLENAGQCQPGYEPCLPMVTDLDCRDIRLPVMVTGEDVYGLDRDGDGQACEVYR